MNATIENYSVEINGAIRDLEAGEIEQYELREEFHGASDLPAEVTFARAYDSAGKPVKIYRRAES